LIVDNLFLHFVIDKIYFAFLKVNIELIFCFSVDSSFLPSPVFNLLLATVGPQTNSFPFDSTSGLLHYPIFWKLHHYLDLCNWISLQLISVDNDCFQSISDGKTCLVYYLLLSWGIPNETLFITFKKSFLPRSLPWWILLTPI